MPVANCCTRFCSKDTAYLVADVLVAAMLITLGSLYLAAGDAPTFKQAILGIYAIVFGVVLLLAEMGIHVIVKTYCQFLDNLFGRGLFYVLVGVLLLEPEPIYQAILGGCVVGTGLVYLILYCIPNARPEKMRN